MHTDIGLSMAGIKRYQHKALGTAKWKKLRLQILDRDDRICAYCGANADTVDHIISRHDGGDIWDTSNLVAACKRCNSMKGKKAFFLARSSTPPVFSEQSLPAQVSFRPVSPFEAPIKP